MFLRDSHCEQTVGAKRFAYKRYPNRKTGWLINYSSSVPPVTSQAIFLHQVRPVTYMNKLIPINNVVMNTIQWYLDQFSV